MIAFAAILTAYCHCADCCGSAGKLTTSGRSPVIGVTVAAPRSIPLGTIVTIILPDGSKLIRRVDDRMSKRFPNRWDLFVGSHKEATRFGIQKVRILLHDQPGRTRPTATGTHRHLEHLDVMVQLVLRGERPDPVGSTGRLVFEPSTGGAPLDLLQPFRRRGGPDGLALQSHGREAMRRRRVPGSIRRRRGSAQRPGTSGKLHPLGQDVVK